MKQIPYNQPNLTSQLYTVLHLAEGERTDISMNVRTDNVLTNGTDNVIELVHLQLIGKPRDIIWVQFDHADIDKENMRIDIYETSMRIDIYEESIGLQWTSIKPERNM